MALIPLLVALLVFCVVVWSARAIMAAFAMPAQIQTVVTVVIVLLFVLWVVQFFGGIGGPSVRLH